MGERAPQSVALDSSSMEGRMKVLAIDTAGWVASCALWENGHEISFGERDQDRSQAALLPELVKEIVGDHKVDQIIVNVGPGSFTGIRLGLAFAKGLSMGWGVPIKGIDSFMTVYLGIEPQDDVLILIEARRQDVYARRFIQGIPQTACSLTREEIEKERPPILAGNGVHPLFDGLSFKEIQPTLRGAQLLGHAYFKAPDLFGDPSPFYVREADVSFPVNP
jgi:tRNA threonylcarbamoyladenosine biosynthesis protein TsaB